MICDECETVAHCMKNGCVPKMTKQTEAMKLALEALEAKGDAWIVLERKAITALREALAESALERMAENARELGLDYEQPAQTDWEAVAADQAMTIALLKSEIQSEQTKKYLIGEMTLEHVFKPAGLENLSNLQAVLDQMEKTLTQQPAQQEPVAGKGKELSERLKLCARNVAFVAAGRVDMSSAAMQEMFALIDHVCAGLDSPPAQRKPLTGEQIDAAVKAWFQNEIVSGQRPFAKRMRAALEAVQGIEGDA